MPLPFDVRLQPAPSSSVACSWLAINLMRQSCCYLLCMIAMHQSIAWTCISSLYVILHSVASTRLSHELSSSGAHDSWADAILASRIAIHKAMISLLPCVRQWRYNIISVSVERVAAIMVARNQICTESSNDIETESDENEGTFRLRHTCTFPLLFYDDLMERYKKAQSVSQKSFIQEHRHMPVTKHWTMSQQLIAM